MVPQKILNGSHDAPDAPVKLGLQHITSGYLIFLLSRFLRLPTQSIGGNAISISLTFLKFLGCEWHPPRSLSPPVDLPIHLPTRTRRTSTQRVPRSPFQVAPFFLLKLRIKIGSLPHPPAGTKGSVIKKSFYPPIFLPQSIESPQELALAPKPG